VRIVSARCPSEAEILLSVLGERARSEDGVAQHLRSCKTCSELRAGLRRVVRGIEASAKAGAGGGNCLDEVTLAEFVAGAEDIAERRARIAHLAGCGHCRQQLAALLELLADSGVTAALRELERTDVGWRQRSRRLIAAAGLVAAAVFVALVWPTGKFGDPFHRAPTITATAAPLPAFPRGDVSEAAALRWTAVAGADRYRVTLFDAEGRVRYQTQTADTMAVLPDSVTLVPERSYLWKVEARTELERWASSELVEFRLFRRPLP
jgi:hypothetical protein